MRSKLISRLAPFLLLALLAVPAMAQETTAHAGAAEAQRSLLDLDMQSAIWVLVIFIILAWVLYQKAWKNVLKGLKAREERIRNDIAQAEQARLKAEATLKDFNAQLATAAAKAQEIIAKATIDAQAVADRIRVQAQKEAEEAKERATRDIDEARDQALRDIYEQAATLATSIAEKILRRNLNADDQRDLVAQSLEQVQKVNRG
ncbi:MAG TPA: F0F1 ATP synthase subunit B [Tepidisphaeraceae bacterium]|jgi:F-type H+-transporting ATPase subunit b|nr:F0F1 ATP synthase subunit B [Tepidisphaeraceae bacterium]